MIPARPCLMGSFDRGNTEGTKSSNKLCLICWDWFWWIDLRICLYWSFDMCICLRQSLTVLRGCQEMKIQLLTYINNQQSFSNAVGFCSLFVLFKSLFMLGLLLKS